MEKKAKYRMPPIIVAILCVVAGAIFFTWQEKRTDRQLVTDLHWKMKGVITGVYRPKNLNGFGIVKVDMLESNLEQYDIRPRTPFYCIIKNSKAVLLQIGAGDTAVGDTVEVDTDKKRFKAYSQRHKIVKEITINDDSRLYDYLENLKVASE